MCSRKRKRSWKRPAHGGGHLEAKKQTTAETIKTKMYHASAKKLWDYLFHADRNKWESAPRPKPHL